MYPRCQELFEILFSFLIIYSLFFSYASIFCIFCLQEHETDVIAFAPVIPEGDDDYTNRAYIVLRNVGSGTVEFGSKTFYIEGPYMIET